MARCPVPTICVHRMATLDIGQADLGTSRQFLWIFLSLSLSIVVSISLPSPSSPPRCLCGTRSIASCIYVWTCWTKTGRTEHYRKVDLLPQQLFRTKMPAQGVVEKTSTQFQFNSISFSVVCPSDTYTFACVAFASETVGVLAFRFYFSTIWFCIVQTQTFSIYLVCRERWPGVAGLSVRLRWLTPCPVRHITT